MFEEQKTIFASDMERDSTYQDLQEMKYLEVFIKESQRIVPAVSFVGREAQENITLSTVLRKYAYELYTTFYFF